MNAKQKTKKIISKILNMLPFSIGVRIKFKYYLGYWPNLTNPKTYNEKIQHRKLSEYPDEFVLLSDKLKVRDYVKNTIGEKYLIDVLSYGDELIYDDFTDLELPYVIKANHNSGPVQIVREKEQLVSCIEEIKRQLKFDYGRPSGELWYSEIERKFLVEKLLLDDKGNVPVDYKFHCFGVGENKVIYVQIDYGRFNDHSRSIYDDKLNLLPFGILYKNENIVAELPGNYDEMLDVVKKLSKPFNYTRVDLYNLKGQVYFGELTFAHGSGFEKFSERKYDQLWGDLWKL